MEDNKVEKDDAVYHLVIYGDGAAGPGNPGPTGAGVHGYLYRDEDIITGENGLKLRDTPPDKNIPTTKGYVLEPHLPRVLLDITVKKVVPKIYFDAIIPYDIYSTNNVGEMVASTYPVEYFLENTDLKIKSINYKTDSQYVIDSYKKLGSDINKSWKYNGAKNTPQLEQMDRLIDIFNGSGIEFKTVKVPGHSLIFGNELSDKLAVTGRLKMVEGDVQPKMSVVTDKYWKPKVVKHPLLRVKDIYFTHHDLSSVGKGLYAIMEYELDVEVGKLSSETMFGVVKLKEPIPELETVIDLDKKINENRSTLSSINMGVYYSQLFQRYYGGFGTTALTPNKSGNGVNVINMNDRPLTKVVTPQGLAKNALDKTLELKPVIQRYRDYIKTGEVDGDFTFIDITDLIFAEGKNKLDILLPMSEKYVKFKHTSKEGKELELTIALGRELIDRNSLKQLEKLAPKIYVEVREVSKRCLYFNTIVDVTATGDIGIYSNFYSSMYIIKD